MKYNFYPDVEEEFDIAIEYYEGCKPRLGEEFAQEVFATIQRS